MSDSILAHFDGERILFDEPVEWEPNTKLIIHVLPKGDDEREQWLTRSKGRFAEAFANAHGSQVRHRHKQRRSLPPHIPTSNH